MTTARAWGPIGPGAARLRVRTLVGVAMATMLLPTTGVSQTPAVPAPVTARTNAAPVPFGPGELLTYKVKWGIFSLGGGSLAVNGVETVRGRPSYALELRLRGGRLGLTVNDIQSSWMDIETLASRRFVQDIHEVNYKRFREYEIYPEEGRWEQNNGESGETMDPAPLDDIAFLYFVRSLPLETGDVYTLDRYFKAKANPIEIHVLRRDTVEVPAGVFETVVVQPIFESGGLFGDGGEAELHFTDDDRRILVYLKTKLSIGNLTLHLEEIQEGWKLQTAQADPPS